MVNCNVEIGDKVYIGGIYGKDFEMFNNKIGKIDKIIFVSYEDYSTYLVDVMVNGIIFPVNFSYIFKVDDLDTFDYDEILNDSPLDYYFKKNNITGKAIIHYDEDGLNKVICKSQNNDAKVFYLTSIN
jgi:hypothetical protein